MTKKSFLSFNLLLIISLLINGCDKLKRFGQEKYICSQNKLSINQIDIIKTNSIKKAYLIVANEEVQLKIDTINKKEVLLSNNNYTIRIDKYSNEVSISDENKIHFLKCKSETFNM